MNASNNSSSPVGRIIPVLLIFAGLVGLYYLYQYLFGPQSVSSYILVSQSQSANIDPAKPITITSDKLPNIYEGGEFTVSTWVYITNWSYRAGFNKSILSVGGPNFDTIRIYLGGNTPKLSVRLQTKDASGVNNTIPTGATSGAPTGGAPMGAGAGASLGSNTQVTSDSLDKGTMNATFGILQTDSGMLDSSPLCDLPEVDLQRWVNITVAVNGKTVDVYLDGKLSRSCVLPSFFKVDAGGYSANLLAYGGFGGQIATTTMYDAALNPEQVYKNYMAGPLPITNIGQWFASFFSPGVSVSVSTK
jgi:hypothetical protein